MVVATRFFFFQAEDGIRDVAVTGVQTCALPILVGPEELGLTLDAVGGGSVDLCRLLRLHAVRSEEHTSELQSRLHLVCRLLLEKKKQHTIPCYCAVGVDEA